MKRILIIALTLLAGEICNAQYIGIKAKYTETRLVDDSPNPPKRENRLILSFFEVTFNGTQNVWTPIGLTNYDLWVYKEGLQYGNNNGGVLDSTGNNYPGYAWTAPKAVAYNNTLGIPYIDCNPNIATHYVVNGTQLDCGFITVSYWDTDWGTGNPYEAFPAPNICLNFYDFGHPYYYSPGNVNFDWSALFPGPPYNLYNFSCGGSLQMVVRGVLGGDSGNIGTPLPVRFAHVRGEFTAGNTARISWSNLTESDVDYYDIEKSTANGSFFSLDTLHPLKNDGGRADYVYHKSQSEQTAFYRIKAVETTGRILYSTIISLRLPDSNSIPVNEPVVEVFPNPVTSAIFTFRVDNAPSGRYISCLVTPSGQQIRQKMIEHNGGNLSRQIDMSGLPVGIYQLVLRSSTKKYTQKIFYVN